MTMRSRRPLLPLLLVAAGASALATGAQARCAIGQFAASGAAMSYDPFDIRSTPAEITVRATADGDCRGARVQFSLVRTNASPQSGGQLVLAGSGGGELSADVRDAGGAPQPVAATEVSAFVSNPPYLPVGAAGVLSAAPTLRLTVAPGQPAPPGEYVAHLLLAARVTDQDGQTTQTATPVDLQAYVTPSVRLAAGTNDLNIDLGELSAGEQGQPVRFDAYANLDYDLVVRSQNGFVLARAGDAGVVAPYQASVSAEALTQAAPGGDGAKARMVTFRAPAGDGRRNHTFNVRLGAFKDLPAGVYSDDVTLEIRAKV